MIKLIRKGWLGKCLFSDCDDVMYGFSCPIELALSCRKVVNGMKPAIGMDEHGNHVCGWVCAIDLLGEQTSTPEEAIALHLRLAERFEATGEYSTAINLYSDEYRAEIMGSFFILDFFEGYAITHGLEHLIDNAPR